MRCATLCLILSLCLGTGCTSSVPNGKVVKVLPHLLDLKGRHTTSPSLYDRDAYQAHLRQHPAECSGIRYDVEWQAKTTTGTVKIILEVRGEAHGAAAREKKIVSELKPGRGWKRWSGVELSGSDFKEFGQITAWRVTLWDGDKLLGEQKSFLW